MKHLSILLLATMPFAAMANDETSAASAPVTALFDAMRAHDADKLKAQFTATAQLQRAEQDGNVRTTEIEKFAQAVATSSSYLDEQLLAIEVEQSGNLASVWTPYVFYRDKQLSHCGVNSFQLIETTEGWKIHYLIDNKHPGDCQVFMQQHKP